MVHTVKDLTVREPAEVEILPPGTYGTPKRLTTMRGIRQEAARIYRLVCTGTVPVEDGTKLFYMLDRLGRLAEAEFLEGRLVALEGGKSVKGNDDE
jgi:hypothetical protein